MKAFEYVYWASPIDFWYGATLANAEETEAVLRQMPEPTRDRTVYKLVFPFPSYYDIAPIYLCKADNNGTTYIFSHRPLESLFEDALRYKT